MYTWLETYILHKINHTLYVHAYMHALFIILKMLKRYKTPFIYVVKVRKLQLKFLPQFDFSSIPGRFVDCKTNS